MKYQKTIRVFVVIIFYKDLAALKRCLESLVLESQISIVIVENWSKENLKDLELVRCVIIPAENNLGFAGGCNVGIRYALEHGAEAVLLLNQDTIVSKNFLEPLLNSHYDIAAPVIKSKMGGKWVYDYGGKVNTLFGRTTHFEVGDPHRESPFGHSRCVHIEVDYVSGCAMLIKKNVFEKIGLLDEKYFLYFEDADFCLRAKKAGFTIGVEPKSVIYHDIKEKAKKPLWQRLQMLKSNFIFINRWVPWYFRPAAYLYWLALSFKVIADFKL